MAAACVHSEAGAVCALLKRASVTPRTTIPPYSLMSSIALTFCVLLLSAWQRGSAENNKVVLSAQYLGVSTSYILHS